MIVGTTSSSEKMPLRTCPAGIRPGQRMANGARKPPSQPRPFSPRNGDVPPSGQENFSAPLSVVKITIVFSAIPSASSLACCVTSSVKVRKYR